MVSWELVHKATVFIAEEMGVALKRSAFSPNIKERMDHSCAVLDGEGRIVAQAEHIPVHLGSFRVCALNAVRILSEEGIELEEGDMLAFNDPYISGTHLNDLTVMAPVKRNGETVAYVINKAHLVDVGGPMPGSINPNARTLYEEGLIVPPVKLVKSGQLDPELIMFMASNFKTPDVTIGDVIAQVAANRVGVRRVGELLEKYELETVLEAWRRSIEYSRSIASSEISGWRSGTFDAEDYLEAPDGDLTVRVKLEIGGGKVRADFSGSSPQVEYPLNAVYGVTYAATVFAVRSLFRRDVPVNEGLYSAIEVVAPEGTIVNPRRPAPVGGGNVETSQRVADTVFLALSKSMPELTPAAGSGTMTNVMMGGRLPDGTYWAYYETIGGGTGGRPGKDGVSGVHVNMTNTLNTPIEVAEREYPLLFTAYRIREGSGGDGLYRGGDGIVRAFKVLQPCRLSVLSDRFRRAPWGLWGGESGKPGRITIVRSDGRREEMPSKFAVDLLPGDEVVIETPGGGGLYRRFRGP
ncbi:MAG: hydantoinase B/oxoprolinase family protein [Nitrososphaerota archaeon]